MGRLDKELLRLQNQSEKLSERMESYVNYMWSEYELTRQGAEALRDEDAPELGQLKRRLEELKSAIRSLEMSTSTPSRITRKFLSAMSS